MAELLLELFSEEIPARMQQGALEALDRLVRDGLKKAGLGDVTTRGFVTPRRLTLVVDGLPLAQPDVSEERRGPRADAPQQAIDGFLRANDITMDQVEKRETPKGTFLFAVIEKKGRETAEVLKEVLDEAVAALPWPKSMRWADNPARWVRPLHSILCVFEGRVVPVSYAGVTAADTTYGHRFLMPEGFKVADFADYEAKLRTAKVLIDPAERAEIIRRDADRAASSEGLTVKTDDGLLREVAGLVEWPVVLMGRIDDEFMDVPDEVLSTSMRSHQKYFSLLRGDGTLAPRFVVVSNMVAEDGGLAIVAGNERVLRARLSDAKFFWDQDRKVRLESRVDKLKDRVFHARLGTDWDKVQRIRSLAVHLAKYIPQTEPDVVDRAALLAKADLTTGMVGEFPELQGVMGRYYAVNDGEDDRVADAVAEHYSPLGPNDKCPSKPISVAVALADKIDTLVGFWGIDEKPTGSKDPFALRRAALGVIRLIIENSIRMPLLEVFAAASRNYVGDVRPAGDPISQPVDGLQADTGHSLLDFFADRLKVHLREQGVRHDLISAVFALGGEDDLVRLLARVEALRFFLDSEDGANLLVAYRRAMNIVRIEEKKDGRSYAEPVRDADLELPEEKALAETLARVQADVAEALRAENFERAMGALSHLRQPVDAFFDKVTVNAEDQRLRANRLRLLSAIGAAMGRVADFSKVEG